MSIIQSYFNETDILQKKYGKRSIVLMQVGSFFEVYGYKNVDTGAIYGSEIVEFKTICDFNMSVKKGVRGCDENTHVLMAGFPEYQIDKYIEKLQRHNFTVAIYTQYKTDKGHDRKLDVICSPGTFFSITEPQHSQYIMCFRFMIRNISKLNKIEMLYIGISLINIVTGHTKYAEMKTEYKKDPSSYDYLERMVSIYTPKEYICVFDSDQYTQEQIQNTLSYIGLHDVYGHLVDIQDEKNPLSLSYIRCEKQTYQHEILQQYCKVPDIEFYIEKCGFHEKQIACQCFVFLLDFVFEHDPMLIHKIKHPEFEFQESDLYMANHSLKQLNIISESTYHNKTNSVLDFTNRTICPMGKRLFEHYLLHPITDETTLNNRYDSIEHALKNMQTLLKVRKELHEVGDIQKCMRAIQIGKYNFGHIQQLHHSLRYCQTILESLFATENTEKYHISCNESLKDIKHVLQFFETEYNANYDTKLYEYQSDDIEGYHLYASNYFQKGKYTEVDLKEKQWIESVEKIHAIRDYICNIFQSLKNKNVQNGCKIHTMDKTGYYLKTTATRSKILQQYLTKIPDPIMIQFNSKFTHMREMFHIENSFQFIQCNSNEKRIENKQLQSLLVNVFIYKNEFFDYRAKTLKSSAQKIIEFTDKIDKIVDTIAYIDVVMGNAIHAKENNYCRPIIQNLPNTSSYLKAKTMRHPLIEVLQTSETYVANDVEFNKNNEGLLLFGTNAVGKSSLIKAVGICLIMAQSGLFVPCSTFEYKPFTKIFTRILGNDNIFKGLSTFAVEMSELNTILRHSDENSIVLGDELCSGTELGSAISIFVAGLMHLSEKHAKYMFATHFHEITEMPEIKHISTLQLCHLAVTFDPKTKHLLYDRKLQPGPGNNLYGLEVCKSMLLPKSFLETANAIRLQKDPKYRKISGRSVSKYNTQKIKTNCELCGEISCDIHHLKYQMYSDKFGFIDNVPVHHKANLLSLCKKCHDSIHSKQTEYRKVKTTQGIQLQEIH